MMNKVFLRNICFFVLAVLVNSCLHGQQDTVYHGMKGTIQVIGNHPFEKLALSMEDGSVFVIRTPKQLRDKMMMIQGRMVIVRYTTVERIDGMNEIHVVEFKRVDQ